MIQQPAGLELRVWFDLGCDHSFKWLVWAPDFEIAANAAKWGHLAHLIRTQPVVGAVIRHACKTESGVHEGAIHFETELTTAAWDGTNGFKPDSRWQVHSWNPLDISPSLLAHCPCNDHGHIKAGRWQRA